MQIETFEQLINVGAGKQFTVQKPANAKPETFIAHQIKNVTMSNISTPILSPGKCSVMMAETKTGIILTIDGAYHTGTGKLFSIFDSYTEAKAFCEKRINELLQFDYSIYDWKGKMLNYLNPYDLKKEK